MENIQIINKKRNGEYIEIVFDYDGKTFFTLRKILETIKIFIVKQKFTITMNLSILIS